MLSRVNILLMILTLMVLSILPASVSAKTTARGALPPLEEYSTDDGQTFSCTGVSGQKPQPDGTVEEWTFNAEIGQVLMISSELIGVTSYGTFDYEIVDPDGMLGVGVQSGAYDTSIYTKSDRIVTRLGPFRIEKSGQYVIRVHGNSPGLESYTLRLADLTPYIQYIDLGQTIKGNLDVGEVNYYFMNGVRKQGFEYKLNTDYATSILFTDSSYVGGDGPGALALASSGAFSDTGNGVFYRTNLHFLRIGSLDNQHAGTYSVTLTKGGEAAADATAKPITTDFESLDCSISKTPDISAAEIVDVSPYVTRPDAAEVHNDMGAIEPLTEHTVGEHDVSLCSTTIGEITKDFPVQFNDYTFEGKAGQVIFLTSPRNYSNQHYNLQMYSPDGNLVSPTIENSYVQGVTLAHAGPVMLTQDGTYTISGQGRTVEADGGGQYAFTLADLTALVPSEPLQVGSQVTGSITPNNHNIWFFELKDGQAVHIGVQATFEPEITVDPIAYDPNLLYLMSAQPMELDLDYSFVTTPGLYMIDLGSIDDIGTGTYTLVIRDDNNPGVETVEASPIITNLGAMPCALDDLQATGKYKPGSSAEESMGIGFTNNANFSGHSGVEGASTSAENSSGTEASSVENTSNTGNASGCTVTALKAANKRGGPGTNFDTAGKIASGATATAIGQKAVGSFTWWKLDDNSWIRSDLVKADESCTNLAEADS